MSRPNSSCNPTAFLSPTQSLRAIYIHCCNGKIDTAAGHFCSSAFWGLMDGTSDPREASSPLRRFHETEETRLGRGSIYDGQKVVLFGVCLFGIAVISLRFFLNDIDILDFRFL